MYIFLRISLEEVRFAHVHSVLDGFHRRNYTEIRQDPLFGRRFDDYSADLRSAAFLLHEALRSKKSALHGKVYFLRSNLSFTRNVSCSFSSRHVPLHEKVFMWELIFIGLCGGSASTYSAIMAIFGSESFTTPCYWPSH